MARTRLPIKVIRDRQINGSSASAISSPDLVDRFSDLKLKNNKMKKNRGRIPLSPVIEIQRQAKLAVKMKAEQLAKKVANHSKGSRPAIPLLLYRRVRDAVEIMNRTGYQEDDLKLPEARICLECRIRSTLLPEGWKYQRENASSLIAGYETVFEMDGGTFII